MLQGEHLSAGFTAAEVERLIQAERSGLVQQYTSQLIELGKQLGATQEAVRAMLQIAGRPDIPVERWPDTLIAIATQFRTMRQALTQSANNDSETLKLRQCGVTALDSGAFNDARRFLIDIRARERAVSAQRLDRVEKERAVWLAGLESEAETCALLARAALGQGDVLGAVAQFQEGLDVLVPVDTATRWSYVLSAAAVLYDFGNVAGRNDALEAAVIICRLALADAPRNHVPVRWATTQLSLGNTLALLGDRKGIEHLVEAVAAFRDALLELVRDPPQWALTQMNLGNALRTLGARANGTMLLEQALEAYQAALTVSTPDRVPFDWALTQMNLGIALRTLGERERGKTRLREAVTTLSKITRDQASTQWTVVQMNLGNALTTLGVRECGTKTLTNAIAVFRDVIKEMKRDRAPLLWATAQMNLGSALQALGEREWGTARLTEAVEAYNAALQELNSDRAATQWAVAKMNLGNALKIIGAREGGTAILEQAVAAHDAALAIFVRLPDKYTHLANICRENREKSLVLLSKRRN